MTDLTCNIIGAGKLGKSLGILLARQLAVRGVVNRTLLSAQRACDEMGTGAPVATMAELPAADIFLLATEDNQLEQACYELAAKGPLRPGDVVFHCSGSMTSAVLSAARQKGAYTATLHPLRSFASPQKSVRYFAGTYCAVEGDAQALELLCPLFEALNAQIVTIHAETKTLYHMASVLASNYVVALSAAAVEGFTRAGLDQETAKAISNNLMAGTVANLQGLSHKEALTGPIERGDLMVLKAHLQALEEIPHTKEIYKTLGKQAQRLTSHTKNIDESMAQLWEENA